MREYDPHMPGVFDMRPTDVDALENKSALILLNNKILLASDSTSLLVCRYGDGTSMYAMNVGHSPP